MSEIPDDGLDAELRALLADDDSLVETATALRRSRPQTRSDPRFKAVLRAQLMREAPAILGTSQAPSWWVRHRGWFAASTAGLGITAAAAAAVLLVVNQPESHPPEAIVPASIAGNAHVNPNDVITVGFNQPMDQASVVSALHVTPATSIHTAWQGNTLTIMPDHHLAANVAYTVTIDHSTARAASGKALTNDVTIAFGTSTTPVPSPAASPSAPPVLALAPLGTASGDVLVFGSNGAVVANGTPAARASQSPGDGSSPSATPSPTASLGSPSPGDTTAPSDGLYLFPSSGGTVRLADHAAAAAVSPDGRHVAYATTNNGHTTVSVVRVDGSHDTQLMTATTSVTSLAWSGNDTVLAATGASVESVDLAHQRHTVARANSGEQLFLLSSGGRYVVGATADPGAGTVVASTMRDLSSGATRTLEGASRIVTFSADESTVSWVNNTGSTPQLMMSPTSTDTPAVVNFSSAVDPSSIRELALSRDGSEVALIAKGGGLSLVTIADGRLRGSIPAPVVHAAFDPTGDHLTAVTGSSALQLGVAPLPETSPATPVSAVPDAATTLITKLLMAQVGDDQTTLKQMATAGSTIPTLPGASRSYLIDGSLASDGTVRAHARLVVDPTVERPGISYADETIVLVPGINNGGAPTVRSVVMQPVQMLAAGPHVLHVAGSRDATVFTVSFDSDLDPVSVTSAISLVDGAGRPLPLTVHYDADSRTATVSVLGPPPSRGALTIETSLVDVSGQHLAAKYAYALSG